MSGLEWPAALSSRPQLIADVHAMELREAWMAAEREFNARSGQAQASDAPRYRVVDGVAVVPVSGALINRYDFLGEGSSYTSYPALTRAIEQAKADRGVRGIVLGINSPGGNADGILTPAAAIRSAREVKPVTALVGSMAASGGYWLAAQAGEIVLDNDFSQVGSIGVYTMHMDVSKLLERIGIDISVISSGRNKVDGHPFAPLPADVRASIQQEVDDLRLMFAREVSAGRPALSEQAALATEARMFSALDPKTGRRPAIDARLADRVSNLSDVITTMATGSRAAMTSTPSIEGIIDMDEIAIRASERTRISEIIGSTHAAGRSAQAEYLAMKTNMTAAEAVGLLAASPKVEAAGPSAQTYQQRKAEAGAEGFVEISQPANAQVKAGWSKAVATANGHLGPTAIGSTT